MSKLFKFFLEIQLSWTKNQALTKNENPLVISIMEWAMWKA